METFGAYLKAQREKKGIRLEEIASITKIHLKSLEMMEKNQFKALPPEPFIRGFITAYAKYVGLEPKDALSRYRQEMVPSAVAATPSMTASIAPEAKPAVQAAVEKFEEEAELEEAEEDVSPDEQEVHLSTQKMKDEEEQSPNELINAPQTFPAKKMALGVGVLGLVLVIGGLIYVGKKNASDDVAVAPSAADKNAVQSVAQAIAKQSDDKPATAPTDTRTVAAADPKAVTSEAPAQVKPADEFKHELVIEGKERTWIKVVVDEEAPIEYFLPEGETATYKAKGKIKVVLGNSAGSKVTHNGEVAPGVKFQGTIRSYIFPENARFPQDAPSKRSPSSEIVEEAANPNPPATATE